MSKEKSIQQLIARYLDREPLSAGEKERLKVWLAEPVNRLQLEEQMKYRRWEPGDGWMGEDPGIERVDEIAHWNQFMRLLEARGQCLVSTDALRKQLLIKRFGYAAASIVFLLVGTELAWLVKKLIQTPNSIYPSVSFVSPPANPAPGGTHATLALSDGRRILLDSAAIGETLSESEKVRVAKTGEGIVSFMGLASAGLSQGDGAILSDAPYRANNNTNKWNVLSTPRGGQYGIALPDGSRVWLNAASSIRFPNEFGSRRIVEVMGEAYFEIAKDASRPFIVRSGDRAIDVLGTSFNVNAYHDEPVFAVSLVEGKVRVRPYAGKEKNMAGKTATGGMGKQGSGGQEFTERETGMQEFGERGGSKQGILVPGQQARIEGGEMRVRDRVNMKAIVSWRDGYFKFDKTDLKEVMRSIGRWYNTDIVYEGIIPEDQFTGTIDRRLSLREVLRNLELGRLRFLVERVNGAGPLPGRDRIVVRPG